MIHQATLDQVTCGQTSPTGNGPVDNKSGCGRDGSRAGKVHTCYRCRDRARCDGERSPDRGNVPNCGTHPANRAVKLHQAGRRGRTKAHETGISGLAKARGVVQNDDVLLLRKQVRRSPSWRFGFWENRELNRLTGCEPVGQSLRGAC